MAISITSSGIQYPSGLTQTTVRPIIKHRFCSGTTVDQVPATGSWSYVTGCEINMGIPTKSNNWYRIEFYSVTDDQGNGGNSGCGFGVWRYTPSAGWVQTLTQGQHSDYDNNLGDAYSSNSALFYVPVHPTYPTEEHRFRIYSTNHNVTAPRRINCSIGNDNRIGNWQNNMMEVMEIDGDFITSGDMVRF